MQNLRQSIHISEFIFGLQSDSGNRTKTFCSRTSKLLLEFNQGLIGVLLAQLTELVGHRSILYFSFNPRTYHYSFTYKKIKSSHAAHVSKMGDFQSTKIFLHLSFRAYKIPRIFPYYLYMKLAPNLCIDNKNKTLYLNSNSIIN